MLLHSLPTPNCRDRDEEGIIPYAEALQWLEALYRKYGNTAVPEDAIPKHVVQALSFYKLAQKPADD